MRRTALVVSLMLVAAACASGTQTGAADATATTTPEPAEDTSAQDGPVDLFPRPEGPLAPDFTMALASGEAFTLSNAQKPVYMIFWAEW